MIVLPKNEHINIIPNTQSAQEDLQGFIYNVQVAIPAIAMIYPITPWVATRGRFKLALSFIRVDRNVP